MRREEKGTANISPKSTAKRKKTKEDIYAYDADAVPVPFDLCLALGGPGVSIHANREKKGKSRWGKHNEMFCSTVRTS